jgi:hypothetical protein
MYKELQKAKTTNENIQELNFIIKRNCMLLEYLQLTRIYYTHVLVAAAVN